MAEWCGFGLELPLSSRAYFKTRSVAWNFYDDLYVYLMPFNPVSKVSGEMLNLEIEAVPKGWKVTWRKM